MKKKNKKRISGINSVIIAALFIAPLVVFAAIYFSNERKNSFVPGSVDIAVNEGNGSSDEGEELEKDYTWVQSGENYIADKDVKIKDNRKNNGEVLRVMYIPMWYDMDENKDATNICSGVFNFNTITQSGDTLIYCDHNSADDDNHDNDKIITLKLKSGWNTNGWSYQSADGCFYYNGTLDGSKMTAQLLDSVELNAKAYELTEKYVFRLDVLADAIQSSGNASDDRNWNYTP